MIVQKTREITPVPGGALLTVEDALLEARFVAANVLRLRLAPHGEFRAEETFILNSEPPPYAAATPTVDETMVVLATQELRAEIAREPFSLRLIDSNGATVAATPTDAPAIEWDAQRRVTRLKLPESVGVYGLGQGAFSRLNLRGLERRMWQEWDGWRHSGNDGIPLALTTAGYGVLLNSSWPSRWAVAEGEPAPMPVHPDWAPAPWPHGEPSGEGHPERLSILLDGGEMDLFFIYGPSLDRILESYTRLTGRPSLPPRWALGLIQCKNRYRSAEELTHVAHEYRRRNLPCDVLVIDWRWFEHFGDLAWVESDWPDPAATMRQLREMGFRVMQAQHPFVHKKARTYQEFKKRGFLVNAPGHYDTSFDHSDPQARAAWWAAFRPLWQQGIRAFWTDMGELEVHPEGTEHFLGPRERVHNVYSLLWSKGLYENQRRESDLRVCALARTAWAGIPRYGTLMWSGDIGTTWEVLHDQVIVGQEVCLSGQPYWTTDIGGFFTDEHFSGELYARWYQWGAFCPIFRTHGTRPANEPWSFGPQVEAICARYARLRYHLLPYIYACARQTFETGRPFMRAMVMDFADDAKAVTAEHQFTFGPALLVAPVTQPRARGREVYLPDGIWYDFWTGRPYQGGQSVTVEAPLDTIPLFVRGGSLIPMGPDVLHADQRPLDEITLHVYPGRETAFELYEDDGDTYAYERGAFAKTRLAYRETGVQQITIGAAEGSFDGLPASRVWHLVLHDSSPPVNVRGDEIALDRDQWTYNLADRTLTVHLDDIPVQKATTVTVVSGSEPAFAPARSPRLGMEVSPAPEPSHLWVRAYVRNPWRNPSLTADFTLTPPRGWQATRLEGGRATAESGGVADTWWELSREDGPTVCAPEVEVAAQVTLEGKLEVCQGRALLTHSYAAPWLVAGPFANRGKGFDAVYPPERGVDPQAAMKGKKGEVHWQSNEVQDCFGYVNLASMGIDAVAYAACAVWSSEERIVWAELAGEEGLKLWCNGKLAITADGPRVIAPQRAEVTLRAGWNDVLVKATRGSKEEFSGRMCGFTFRFVDKDGAPVQDLLYAAQH